MTEQIKVHYFAEGAYLGAGFQDEEFRGKKATGSLTFWSPNSFVIVCPTCGVMWAKGLSEHPCATFHSKKGKCFAHGGGSLILHATRRELVNLPQTKEFLSYELMVWHISPELYPSRRLIAQGA